MVRFLIRVGFGGAALIRGRKLLEDGAYSGLSINSAVLIIGRRLSEARGLLEEVRLVIILFSLKFQKKYIYITQKFLLFFKFFWCISNFSLPPFVEQPYLKYIFEKTKKNR